MTPPSQDLLRQSLVMRRIRAVVAVLVPVEMLLYVPPPGVASPLRPIAASVAVVVALLTVTAVSAAVHRRVHDPAALARWGWFELASDAAIALGVLEMFAFDQFSSIWTVLVIVVLEGAFRKSLRGAVVMWGGTTVIYSGIQIQAAHSYPVTAPLDIGSIVFRALVVGVVAVVAGQLASQLEAAVERHRRSEVALAGQYADLKLIGRVSRAIAAGPEARGEVCQAVSELSAAEIVILFELGGDQLRGTAVAGVPLEALAAISVSDPASGTAEAFRTRRLVHRRVARLSATLVAAAEFSPSAVNSATFVPVLRDDRPIGVLVLVFANELAELPPRIAAALDVMAQEASVAIARADEAVTLSEQARRDPLTGLVNRRGWEETLRAEMARAKRSGAPLSMLMLDLDGLKTFNDTFGHQAGDQLLAAVSRAWESRLRPTDVMARFGGDEFVAVLPGCEQSTASRVADALLSNLPPGASCSVGVAEWDRIEDGTSLVERADAALYEGKRAGGGRAVLAAAPAAAVPPQRDPGSQAELRGA